MRSSRFFPAAILAIVLSALAGGFFGSSALATQDEVSQQYRVFTHALAAIDREYVEKVPSERLVYGAIDGAVTTFAVVAGVAGAALSPRVVLILSISNLLADGFSMGASNYLAIRSRTSAELEVSGSISEPYAVRHG